MKIYYDRYKSDLKSLRNSKDKDVSDEACFHLKVLYRYRVKTLEDIYRNKEDNSIYLVMQNIKKKIEQLKKRNFDYCVLCQKEEIKE